MTPAETLAVARDLIASGPPWWPRAAALLGRRALEQDLAIRVAARHGRPDEAPFTSQLLVLRGLVAPHVATRAAWAWAGLSAVIHQDGYEIPPTAEELEAWFSAIEDLIASDRRGAR